MATTAVTQETQHDAVALATKNLSAKRNVQTTLNYYNDLGNGSLPMPVYVGSTTVKNERPMVAKPVVVRDITGEEDKFTLSSHGFQVIQHQSQETEFLDEKKIRREYYPECVNLMKQITGASRVHIFGHQCRRGPSNWHKLGEGNAKNKGPLHRVHIDQSYDGAKMELKVALPDEADQLIKRRWQIINLWRPIKTVHKDPLAVACAHSIPESDLVAANIIYPTYQKESWTIRPNASHQWYFKNEQRPEEVLLIKCFDSSAEEGLARRAPHCAFTDPQYDSNEWPWRESCEVRCLVFY